MNNFTTFDVLNESNARPHDESFPPPDRNDDMQLIGGDEASSSGAGSTLLLVGVFLLIVILVVDVGVCLCLRRKKKAIGVSPPMELPSNQDQSTVAEMDDIGEVNEDQV